MRRVLITGFEPFGGGGADQSFLGSGQTNE